MLLPCAKLFDRAVRPAVRPTTTLSSLSTAAILLAQDAAAIGLRARRALVRRGLARRLVGVRAGAAVVHRRLKKYDPSQRKAMASVEKAWALTVT